MAKIEVGGEVGTAGPVDAPPGRIAAVLDRAEPTPAATHATIVSGDGYRASIPLQILRDGGMFSVENAELRLRVLDGDTLCWNVKGVARIEVTVGKQPDDVPAKPGH